MTRGRCGCSPEMLLGLLRAVLRRLADRPRSASSSFPRLATLFLQEDKTYVLYGFHYWLQRIVALTSNSRIYNLLFGDTSYIVNYLRRSAGT